MNLIRPFGELIKEALKTNDTSMKTKMEIETSYIDAKYYMDVLGMIKDQEIKHRLLNCLLINRHFMMIL